VSCGTPSPSNGRVPEHVASVRRWISGLNIQEDELGNDILALRCPRPSRTGAFRRKRA